MSHPTRRASGRNSVFINCPFDAEYLPIFRSIVFTVAACGFRPRCTLEHDDASQVRIEKIYHLIEQSALGIHDVSRTEADKENALPRFNMPLELGLFLGAKRFGTPSHRRKRCLVLDTERYRFQKFISDIAGQDIRAHHGKPKEAVTAVRDWLRNTRNARPLPSGTHLWSDYEKFSAELPSLCDSARLSADSLTFTDFYDLAVGWLKALR